MAPEFRFTATIRRPQGARVFKGTMNGCPNFDAAILVTKELLLANKAFEDGATSIQINISPTKKNNTPKL